jgi:hypothetical protein
MENTRDYRMQVELQWALLQDLAEQDRPDVVTRRPVQQARGRPGDPQSVHGRATGDCAGLAQQRAGRCCGARLQAGSPRSQRGPGAVGTCSAAKPRAHSPCRAAWVARAGGPRVNARVLGVSLECLGSVLGVSWEGVGRWRQVGAGGSGLPSEGHIAWRRVIRASTVSPHIQERACQPQTKTG